jgi:hypothetical protein
MRYRITAIVRIDRKAYEGERLSYADVFHVSSNGLRATPDGDGSLLDHSLIAYGSGMSDGNGHTGSPLPLLLIGGASGSVRGNRHIRTPQNTPMANVLLNVSQKFGVEQTSFGVSTGDSGPMKVGIAGNSWPHWWCLAHCLLRKAIRVLPK